LKTSLQRPLLFSSPRALTTPSQLPICWRFTVGLLVGVNLERAFGGAEVIEDLWEMPVFVLWSLLPQMHQDRICKQQSPEEKPE